MGNSQGSTLVAPDDDWADIQEWLIQRYGGKYPLKQIGWDAALLMYDLNDEPIKLHWNGGSPHGKLTPPASHMAILHGIIDGEVNSPFLMDITRDGEKLAQVLLTMDPLERMPLPGGGNPQMDIYTRGIPKDNWPLGEAPLSDWAKRVELNRTEDGKEQVRKEKEEKENIGFRYVHELPDEMAGGVESPSPSLASSPRVEPEPGPFPRPWGILRRPIVEEHVDEPFPRPAGVLRIPRAQPPANPKGLSFVNEQPGGEGQERGSRRPAIFAEYTSSFRAPTTGPSTSPQPQPQPRQILSRPLSHRQSQLMPPPTFARAHSPPSFPTNPHHPPTQRLLPPRTANQLIQPLALPPPAIPIIAPAVAPARNYTGRNTIGGVGLFTTVEYQPESGGWKRDDGRGN